MSRKQLIAGIVCAVIAVLAVFGYTASVGSEAQVARAAALKKYGGEQTQVVVASKAVSAGETLDSSNTKEVKWVVDLLPDADVATELEDVDGLVAQVDMAEGEVVLTSRVGDGVARINVPSGLEAVSVASDDVLAVGGAIKAGSFVDVYVETSSGSIALLGQQILVLETSAISTDDDSAALTWVTLAVTPDSVSELISASTKGTIHLALPGNQTQKEED